MTDLTVIYWRDIPTQVLCGSGRKSTKRALADRFLVAVDKAAMAAGLCETDDYLAQWHKIVATRPEPDPLEAVTALADELEKNFPTRRLAEIARNGGIDQQD